MRTLPKFFVVSFLIFFLLAATMLTAPTMGQEIWTGTGDNAWENPGNWSHGILPGTAPSVYFVDVRAAVNSPMVGSSYTLAKPLRVIGGGLLEINDPDVVFTTGGIALGYNDSTDAYAGKGLGTFNFKQGTLNSTTITVGSADSASGDAPSIGGASVFNIGDGTTSPSVNLSSTFRIGDHMQTGIVNLNSGSIKSTNYTYGISMGGLRSEFNFNSGTVDVGPVTVGAQASKNFATHATWNIGTTSTGTAPEAILHGDLLVGSNTGSGVLNMSRGTLTLYNAAQDDFSSINIGSSVTPFKDGAPEYTGTVNLEGGTLTASFARINNGEWNIGKAGAGASPVITTNGLLLASGEVNMKSGHYTVRPLGASPSTTRIGTSSAGTSAVFNISGGSFNTDYPIYIGSPSNVTDAELNISGNANVSVRGGGGIIMAQTGGGSTELNISGGSLFVPNNAGGISNAHNQGYINLGGDSVVNISGGSVAVNILRSISTTGTLNIFGSAAKIRVGVLGDVNDKSIENINFHLGTTGVSTIETNDIRLAGSNINADFAGGLLVMKNSDNSGNAYFDLMKGNVLGAITGTTSVTGLDFDGKVDPSITPKAGDKSVQLKLHFDNAPTWDFSDDKEAKNGKNVEYGDKYVVDSSNSKIGTLQMIDYTVVDPDDHEPLHPTLLFRFGLDEIYDDAASTLTKEQAMAASGKLAEKLNGENGNQFAVSTYGWEWDPGIVQVMLAPEALNGFGTTLLAWDFSKLEIDYSYMFEGSAVSGKSNITLLDITAVPEPSTWVMLLLGALAVFKMRRRKAG